MLNSFINSPMVCGLLGSARTYALTTVFSLYFSYLVFIFVFGYLNLVQNSGVEFFVSCAEAG